MEQVTESCSLAGSRITRPDLLRPTMRSGGCCWSGGVLGGKEAGGVGNLSEAGAVVSSCSPKSASKNAGLRLRDTVARAATVFYTKVNSL